MISRRRWLVEGLWDLGWSVVPIRSIVRASSRPIALRRAPRAVKGAVYILSGRDALPGKAAGPVQVLREVGPDFPNDVRKVQP